jgi:hypothetical protein
VKHMGYVGKLDYWKEWIKPNTTQRIK